MKQIPAPTSSDTPTSAQLEPDADGMVSIEAAAAYMGIEVKRLRGYLWRNSMRDPIGCPETGRVYAFSVERWKKRQAAAVA